MKVYAVLIMHRSGSGSRWIDSQWAEWRHANERQQYLESMFKAFDVAASAQIYKMSVDDAEIKTGPASTDSSTAGSTANELAEGGLVKP